MKRIICIGNRYIEPDNAGPLVYDQLQQQPLPPNLEVVDGGIAGLNLLRWIEGMERVVFVDRTAGATERGEPVRVFSAAEVAATARPGYDHAAGLPYLLRVLPEICVGPLPEIAIVGIGGVLHPATIEKATALALQVVHGAL